MAMNKKGFLKIMEAIIATIIVLGFVVTIASNIKENKPAIPPDLEQTTNSILEEMQNNPEFRECVLGGSGTYNFGNQGQTTKPTVICINGYIELLSYPQAAHPWKYGIKTCKINDLLNPPSINCDYFINGNRIDYNKPLNEKEEIFQRELPTGTNIYTRAIILTVPDSSKEGTSTIVVTPGEKTTLTIYAWLKE
jgi:hypothetical protein